MADFCTLNIIRIAFLIMKLSSGWLSMSKRDRECIESVLRHCEHDISFGGGGTFTKGDADNSADEKEIAKARRGIECVRWILSSYLD